MKIIKAGFLKINTASIHFQVLEGSMRNDKNQPYLLMMQGGPGFGFEILSNYIKGIHRAAEARKLAAPRIIIFDPIGCGKSSKPTDYAQACTVENYAEVAAQVVEQVRELLQVQRMDLTIWGRSFGSMEAMTMPLVRPNWPNDQINLQRIISLKGPIDSLAAERALQFVKEHFPGNERMIAAAQQLNEGDFPDFKAFYRYSINIIPAYDASFTKLIEGRIGSFIRKYPRITLAALRLFDKASYLSLATCQLDILRHFFKHQFNGFDLVKIIQANQTAYKKIPIVFMSGENDHVADTQTNSGKLHQQCLPETSALISFSNQHFGSAKDVELENDMVINFVHGKFLPEWERYPNIKMHIPEQFRAMHQAAIPKAPSVPPSLNRLFGPCCAKPSKTKPLIPASVVVPEPITIELAKPAVTAKLSL